MGSNIIRCRMYCGIHKYLLRTSIEICSVGSVEKNGPICLARARHYWARLKWCLQRRIEDFSQGGARYFRNKKNQNRNKNFAREAREKFFAPPWAIFAPPLRENQTKNVPSFSNSLIFQYFCPYLSLTFGRKYSPSQVISS